MIDAPTWYGLTILVLAIFLLLVELKYYTHLVSGIVGAILFVIAAVVLLQGPLRFTPVVAISVAAALGIITICLVPLGMRVRKAKLLTGPATLVGEIGVSRTELSPEGTVFVHGEYWRAHSDQKIAAGHRVAVERVQEGQGDLMLFVKEIQ